MLKTTMIGIAAVALVTVFVNPATAQIVQGPESQKAAIAIPQYQAVRPPIEPSQGAVKKQRKTPQGLGKKQPPKPGGIMAMEAMGHCLGCGPYP